MASASINVGVVIDLTIEKFTTYGPRNTYLDTNIAGMVLCNECGALVPEAYIVHHDDWHVELIEKFEEKED